MDNFKIQWARSRDVNFPKKGNKFDAGYDAYIPNDLTVSDIIDNCRYKKTNQGLIPYTFIFKNEDKYVYAIVQYDYVTEKYTTWIYSGPYIPPSHFISSNDLYQHTKKWDVNNLDKELSQFGKLEQVIIESGAGILIPIGIYTKFSNEYVLIVDNRSGIASKRGLLRGAGVIDSGYTGEIFINLNNVTNKQQSIFVGERIVQLIPYKIGLYDCTEQDLFEDKDLMYKDFETDRGSGGFGSTGSR